MNFFLFLITYYSSLNCSQDENISKHDQLPNLTSNYHIICDLIVIDVSDLNNNQQLILSNPATEESVNSDSTIFNNSRIRHIDNLNYNLEDINKNEKNFPKKTYKNCENQKFHFQCEQDPQEKKIIDCSLHSNPLKDLKIYVKNYKYPSQFHILPEFENSKSDESDD